MKLIIAGSRTLYPSAAFILDSIKLLSITNITEIVSGGAEGVDQEGEHFASHMNLPVRKFKANWDFHGKSAGPIRNEQMAEYGDALLLIWDGKSRGSANIKKCMALQCKPIFEVRLDKINETGND